MINICYYANNFNLKNVKIAKLTFHINIEVTLNCQNIQIFFCFSSNFFSSQSKFLWNFLTLLWGKNEMDIKKSLPEPPLYSNFCANPSSLGLPKRSNRVLNEEGQNITVLKIMIVGWEPWSSGYERRLIFRRLWVQIPAPYTGWAFLNIHLFVLKIVMFVWKD